MTATLAGSLVVLALIDSTSFGTLLIPLWFLTAPGRVRVGRVLLFLATVAAAYLVVGVALVTGAGALADTVGGLADRPAAAWAQLVLGVGLVLVGVLVPVGRGKGEGREREGPGRAARWRERAVGGSGGAAGLVTVSVLAVALELPTMLPYLAAVGLLAAADLGGARGAAVLAGYCLVMVTPALALLTARVLAGRWVEPALGRLARWVERGSGETLAWVVAIIGVLLVGDALGRLPEIATWVEQLTAS